MTTSTAAVARAGELLRRRIGLRVEASLYLRLARAVGDAALLARQEPDDFVAALTDDAGSLQSLCDRVTVQESGFFRHPEHFDVLARHLLPAISGPVRIWSAGCGNGQEPYSLAMLLAEHGIDGRIIATDVSKAAVRRTQAAQYSGRELTGLSSWRQEAHGTMSGSSWTVAPALRGRVDASVHNLLDAVPAEVALCQIVFCCNVLIYFTSEHATAFVDRLADTLHADAHLFLGGAESMLSVSDRFEPRHLDDTFVYRVRRPRQSPARRAPGDAAAGAKPLRPRRAGGVRAPSRGAARQRRTERPPRRSKPADTDLATATELARLGREAHDTGDHAGAVRAFRKWAYLSPDDPLAHFHLGLALEAGGHRAAALRSFAVSRTLLASGDASELVEAFGGYGIDDILRLIATKEAASE